MTRKTSSPPYRNQLYYRLLVVYFILIVVPILIVMAMLYFHLLNLSKHQVLDNGLTTFQTTTRLIDNKFYNCQTALHIISDDAAIYQLANANHQNDALVDQLKNSQYLVKMFNNVKSSTLISHIQVFLNQNHMLTGENINFFPLSAVNNSPWYRQMSLSKSNTLWFSPQNSIDATSGSANYYSLIRRFYDPDNLVATSGYIKISLEESIVLTLMNHMNVTPNTFSVIAPHSDTLSFEKQHFQISQSSFDNIFNELFHLADATSNTPWQKLTVNGQSYFLSQHSFQHAPYDFYIIIPYNDIFKQSLPLLLFMATLIIIISSLAYLLAIKISKSTLSRISHLANSMQKVESGDLTVRCTPKGNDEITALTLNFNNMIERTNQLIDEKYSLGKELKNQELKALQAQINPHFLYNSLHLINCIAIRHQLPEINNMVNALSKFYRLSLAKGRDTVLLREELEHVRLYTYIQNMRFQNRIHFSVQCDSSLLELPIIKILLQPLVENAIIHGIFEKESKTGYVTVKVTQDNDRLYLHVIDDGVGIPPYKLDMILSTSHHSSGYGVKNVHLRIQNYYGKDYGLTFSDNPQSLHGTIATLTLPYPLID